MKAIYTSVMAALMQKQHNSFRATNAAVEATSFLETSKIIEKLHKDKTALEVLFFKKCPKIF